MTRDFLFDDGFEDAARFGRENRGAQPATSLTDWGLLARGKTIGNSANLRFTGATSAGPAQSAPTDILELNGADENALQLCVTLAPPEIYDNLLGSVADLQNLNGGTYDNIAMVNVFPQGLVGGRVTGVRNDRGWANPIAIVEWGSGGVRNRCEADFINGLCLNLCGNFVRVTAFVDGNAIITGANDAIWKLRAVVGPGYPKANNAQRTVLMSDATAINTESDVYTVPRFAKSVHVCGANAAHDTFVGSIRFYRTPNGPADGSFVADYIFAGNTAGPIPIPNGAYYFTFVPGIADAFSVMAVFQLAV